MTSNVSWWLFFGFHTLSKVFTRENVLKLGKNCVLVTIHSDFVGRENFFYALLAPNMCIHKLPYDHGFAQKQPKSVFDALIKFYYHKHDAMVTFCRWYFLRRILHSFTIKVTLRSSKLCFADLPLCLCGPWENFSSELPTPNMYWKTSLWSYLHAEMNWISFGYFNAMIYPQTWADGTFLDFIPPQRRLEGKLDWKKLRQLCILWVFLKFKRL